MVKGFLVGVTVLVAVSLVEAAGALHRPGEVIVRFTEEAWAAMRASQDLPRELAAEGVVRSSPTLSPVRGRLSRMAKRYGFHRVYTLEVPDEVDVPELARRLAALPAVEYAHPNYVGRGGQAAVEPADTSFASQWNLNNTGQFGGTAGADIGAAPSWRLAAGRRETIVAVLDSGIDSDHPDIRGRHAPGGWDFVGEDDNPESDHPHGIRVSGVLAAETNNGFALSGVNWRARLVTIKVLNSINEGTTVDLVQGLVYAAELGANVANLSLVDYPPSAPLADAVDFAGTAGVVLIGCNGNNGTSSVSYPASYAEVVSAGHTDASDQRSSDSNFNTTLDVMAPGELVPVLLWNSSSDGFLFGSGCSLATPHVSGVAAAMLAMDPTLTHEQIREILIATAEDEIGHPAQDVPGRDNYYGWGRVNMDLALESLGLTSEDLLHVDAIDFERVDPTTLEIRVAVADDLTGVEEGVQVQGTLTLPDTSSVPMHAATSSNGVATFVHAPGGSIAGEYAFEVTDLVKSGFVYDAASNHRTSATHDPDLAGLHVESIEMTDDFDSLTIEVVVVDDGLLPQNGVEVRGTLHPPAGPPKSVNGFTRLAAGGLARLVHSPTTLDPGLYTFEITNLVRSGFVYEAAKDVESVEMHAVHGASDDFDQDGVDNEADNCISIANAPQADADNDGFGDDCDVCPERNDPSQRDTDGDGVGDRCDCAPYDAARTGIGSVKELRILSDQSTLEWNGVVGADYYDVSRGMIHDLDGSDYGACRFENHGATSVTDPDPPPSAGEGYFYLVRGDDATCGPGSLGTDGAAERVNGNAQACLP